jgi:hypothetical protein
MSLKGGIGMLGIDHQHGRFGSDEPGADPGVSGRQRRSAVCRTAPRRGIRLDGGTLVRHEYAGLGRTEKGWCAEYVARMTGLSRAQVTRLITSYADSGRVKAAPYQREVRDPLHESRRGTAGLCRQVPRQPERAGDKTDTGARVQRIRPGRVRATGGHFRGADLPVPQLGGYRKSNTSYQPTRPTPIPIGERRKPRPQGRPGYLRIDTVHQGDRDGVKGIYHINAVDEVTQWEIVAATPQISEYWLIPLLEQLLEQFPFVIRGFHSDNGSEFINYTVARLLDKLLIEQTKSRAHRTGDNGLVESKNGAIIRKHMGFGHIAAQHAEAVDQFHRRYLNPYVNFHRPCAVAEIVEQPNGKRQRVYRKWATPFEIFSQAPQCESCVCGPVSAWPIWKASPKRSPIPKPPSKCKKQTATDGRNRETQRYSRMSSCDHAGCRTSPRGRNSAITGLMSITGVPSMASSSAT